MILYMDTSSLVKLYVEETGSTQVRAWLEEADAVATCRIAYPETLSAMTRRWRNGDLAQSTYDLSRDSFTQDWRHYVVLDFDELEAGRLVTAYGLRGLDAVHLSSAKLLASRQQAVVPAFSSFDRRLNDAAAAEGFIILTGL